MPKEIVLDKKTFEALAIDTRVNILKSLKKRNKTASELSKELKLAVSTVSEHLDKMKKAGLIKRKEDHRKWVYYQLTEKGEGIVSPIDRNSVFVLALSLSLLMLVLGFYWLNSMGSEVSFGAGEAPRADGELTDYGLEDQPNWAGKATVEIFNEYEEAYGINIQALIVGPPGPSGAPVGFECQTNEDCGVGGCSGQVCGNVEYVSDLVTSCEWLPEYACLSFTNCACVNNMCQWENTTEYNICLNALE